jgi:hypothetical protein
VALYSTGWTWIPAALLLAVGISLCSHAGAHFSLAQLGGLSEIRANHQDDRLVTTGIRARVRHPVYLAHLCELMAWSAGTRLVVCWLLTGFAIVTGAVMIRMEDKELEKRFGDEYRKYRSEVPAVLPNPTVVRRDRPRLSSDGVWVRYEIKGKGSWQIAIADLVCIGEYTTSGGPFVDDYLLVFARKDGLWNEASFYSEGCEKAIEGIGNALGCRLNLGLAHSTTLASRIIWPKQLQGQPIFVEGDVSPEVKRLTGVRQL